MTHDFHDHDGGFAVDLPRLVGRRAALALLGGGAIAAAGSASAMSCVGLPWETAGPYPADGSAGRGGTALNVLTEEGVIRSDMKSSFGALSGEADGAPFQMDIVLVDAADCSPLVGHAIYVWHCDALGQYSLYDLPNENFLRAVGVSDAEGRVQFTTIYPGCYPSRWPHIHFEVFSDVEKAVSGSESILTAQIALPETTSAAVYEAHSVYENGARNLSRNSLSGDMVFADNGAEALAQQTMAVTGSVESGLVGTVVVPIDLNAARPARAARPDGPPPGRRPRSNG